MTYWGIIDKLEMKRIRIFFQPHLGKCYINEAILIHFLLNYPVFNLIKLNENLETLSLKKG